MVSHWLVEIQGRGRRRIEARKPHCADEYQAEGIVGVFEARVEVLVNHLSPMRGDVETELSHVGFFV